MHVSVNFGKVQVCFSLFQIVCNLLSNKRNCQITKQTQAAFRHFGRVVKAVDSNPNPTSTSFVSAGSNPAGVDKLSS